MSDIENRRSNAWFLLPIFLNIFGGLIAFFVLKEDDPQKAKNCLILGIMLLVVGVVLNLVLQALILDTIMSMFVTDF